MRTPLPMPTGDDPPTASDRARAEKARVPGPLQSPSLTSNPYAAPRSEVRPLGATQARAGQTVRRLYTACAAVVLATVAWAFFGTYSLALGVTWGLAGVGTRMLSVVWIYRVFSDVPEMLRAKGTKVTPARAIFYFAIPVFNLLWLFGVHGALANAVEAELAHTGRRTALPRHHAYGAMGLVLLSSIVFATGSEDEARLLAAFLEAGGTILFAVWMREVERARASEA